MDNITFLDYILLPVYLVGIYIVAIRFRNRHYPAGHPWRAYFLSGLTVKILGAIAIGLLYYYYYGGAGDSFKYFYHARLINNSRSDPTGLWWRLITHTADLSRAADNMYVDQLYWYDDAPSYTVGSIAALAGLVTFTKYLLISVLFASVAFTGCWALFRTFASQYPALIRPVAIATLFIPSTIIWGSGLFKDTICMFALGWLTYCFYKIFERKKPGVGTLVMVLLSIYLLATIKAYILLSFLPLLIIKTIFSYRNQIENSTRRTLFIIVAGLLTFWVARYSYEKVQDTFKTYAIENIAGTVKKTSDFILQVSQEEEGAGYSLGEFDPTLQGLATKLVPAINVSLFRPYLWEVRNPLMILAALESLVFLIFTLKVLLTNNPFRSVSRAFKDPNILFCIVFTLLFAFFTGITSYNFGTLSRYRIPCLPFFTIALILLDQKRKIKKEQLS